MQLLNLQPPFSFKDAFGFHVNRAAFAVRSTLRRRFRAAGFAVTPEEWAMLNILWRDNGASLGTLASRTIKDKTTVTRIIDALVRKGLVRRDPDPNDRRVVRARLTARGRRLETQLIPIAEGVLADATAGVPACDLETTQRVLARVFDNLIGVRSGPQQLPARRTAP